MNLAPGSRLGPYTIVDRLGAGGMGEVYRAKDSRLGRTVAIKVLPGFLSLHPEARLRFRREARTLSQLTHPHICALYDVGEEGDTDYLVMEMIEGETLSERLRRGPLPIDDVLALGTQIAAALDQAHRSGIAHRDLKPGNIMLTASGAKLLDFGLAKLVVTQGVAADGSTVQDALTSTGAVVGTFQYMAPEQLEGRAADFRSDIFALGAVLFEMSTGRRAFPGETTHAIAGAILTLTPPFVSTVRPNAPAALDRLVAICLEKNPDHRWQSAHDVALLLKTSGAPAVVADLATSPKGPTLTRLLPWALASLAAALALTLWLRPTPVRVAQERPVTFTVPPPPGDSFRYWVEASEMALSPDGTQLAFIGSNGGVWIRPLGSLTAAPVKGAEGANAVFWSPDSKSIAFFGSGMLKRVDAGGGVAVPLCTVSKWTGHGGSWGSDGIVFAAINGKAIFRVSTGGGTPVALLKPNAAQHELRLLWPHFLPDGRRLLYTAWHDDRSARLMLWEPDRQPREIMPVMSNVEYVEPGYLLFVHDGALFARRFDPATATASGDPIAVVEPVAYALIPGLAHFTSSRNGVLAYQPHSDLARIAWFDRSGRELGTALPTGKYQDVRFSPDGRQLLFDRTARGGGSFDLWSLDVDRGIETRLTSDQGNEIQGLWTSDQSTLVYSAGPNGPPQIVIRDATTGRERLFQPESALQIAEDVTPDGQSIVYRSRPDGAGSFRLLVAPLKGGSPAPVFDTPFNYMTARFSPNGDWLAYADDETGQPDVYVARWPLSKERLRVSTDGGRFARWSPDGRELFYLSQAGLMTVPMAGGSPGKATLLLDSRTSGTWSDFGIDAHGRFLAIVAEAVGAEEPLTVVVNWRSRLP